MHTPVAPAPLPKGRFYITSSLGTLLLPRDWTIRERLPASRPDLDLLGRDGTLATGRRAFSARTGSLNGELAAAPGIGPDAVFAILWPPEAGEWGWGPNNTQVDALLRVLQGSPVRLRKDDPEGRWLDIEITDLNPTEISRDRSRFALNWEAKQPFWTSHHDSISTGSMGNGDTRPVTVAGNVSVQPVITITGPAVNPRIVNETNGTSLQYQGTLNAGNELVLDCNEITAYRSAVSVLGVMDGAYAVGFHLDSGPNILRFEADSGTAGVDLTWKDRWY